MRGRVAVGVTVREARFRCPRPPHGGAYRHGVPTTSGIRDMPTRTPKSKSIEQEIADLRREILEHDHRYYTLSEPVISDAEYDALMRRLRELEAERPDLIT